MKELLRNAENRMSCKCVVFFNGAVLECSKFSLIFDQVVTMT